MYTDLVFIILKVTIYDNTLNPVVTKTPHFPQRINNIYEFHTACKGLY